MSPAMRQLVELLARAAWEELKKHPEAERPQTSDLPKARDAA